MNIRYFIVPYPVSKSIMDVSICTATSVRVNNAKDKSIIRLADNDTNTYEVLAPYQEYNHEQILQKTQEEEWQTPLF